MPGYPVRILHLGRWEDEEVFGDSMQITLEEIFRTHKIIGYEYDFGDGWEHIIRLKRILEDCTESHPHCIHVLAVRPWRTLAAGGVCRNQDDSTGHRTSGTQGALGLGM